MLEIIGIIEIRIPVNFSFKICINTHLDHYTLNMKQNLRQKEFLTYFQMLKEQPTSSYTHAQFIELKKYVVFLFDFFIWK